MEALNTKEKTFEFIAAFVEIRIVFTWAFVRVPKLRNFFSLATSAVSLVVFYKNNGRKRSAKIKIAAQDILKRLCILFVWNLLKRDVNVLAATFIEVEKTAVGG